MLVYGAERVVVLDNDGYFTGVAMAELLADRGCAVTLVVTFAEVSPFSNNTRWRRTTCAAC